MENDGPSESDFNKENRNCQSYSEIMSSLLSNTILSDSETADKISSLDFKQRQTID